MDSVRATTAFPFQAHAPLARWTALPGAGSALRGSLTISFGGLFQPQTTALLVQLRSAVTGKPSTAITREFALQQLAVRRKDALPLSRSIPSLRVRPLKC